MSEDSDREVMLNWLLPTPWTLRASTPGSCRMDVASRVLAARGFDSPEKRRQLFDLNLADIPDPFRFRDMEAACLLVEKCLEESQPRLLIFGDYDADGLTAATLLARYFQSRGHKPVILIPDRFDDGYGLSPALVEEIELHRPHLVITVDTGTSSPDAVRQIMEAGIPVIVTDHHLVTDAFQSTGAPLLNPALPGEAYPYDNLSGAGVALLFTLALDSRLGPVAPSVRDSLFALAAVGTIADVVPLTGVNRIIVRHGLEVFKQRSPEGLKAIGRCSALNQGRPSARDVAFSIAPRLNAAGRMGDVRLAVDLLMEDDPARADQLAAKLDDLNRQRRQAEQEVFKEALEGVLAGEETATRALAIAHGSNWHAGVLGIVSSRLVEKLRVPAITLNEDKGILTGSARSFGSIDLIQAINSAGHLLEKYGGHAGAAGLTLKADKLEAFRRELTLYLESLPLADRQQAQLADIKLEGGDLEIDQIGLFDAFEPTGSGFERPVVWLDDLTLESLSRVGDGRHLKLLLRTPDPSMRVVEGLFFGRGDEGVFYQAGDLLDVLAVPEINRWRDKESVQLRLLDLRPADQDRINEAAIRTYGQCLGVAEGEGDLADDWPMTFSQALFTSLWQLASSLSGPERKRVVFLPVRLAWLLSHRYNVEAEADEVLVALRLFQAVDLLELEPDKAGAFAFTIKADHGRKPALSDSALWKNLKARGILKL